jgi:hypothetical protein
MVIIVLTKLALAERNVADQCKVLGLPMSHEEALYEAGRLSELQAKALLAFRPGLWLELRELGYSSWPRS